MQVSRFIGANKETAAGNRRRFSVRLALSAVVLVTLAGCAHRPTPAVDAARRAAQRAIAILRPQQPAQARLIERLVALAEIATAAEANAPWWEGSIGRTEAAWMRVVRTASVDVAVVRTADERANERYARLHPNARSEVARAMAEINEAGMGPREAAAMQSALVSISIGEKLAAVGRLQEAADELARAHADAALVHRRWIALHARFSDPANLRMWRSWAEQTIAESRETGGTAILVDKLRRRVFLYRAGRVIASYPAELGANGLVRKEHSGDRATPEGRYHVIAAKRAPETKFDRALLINYPNEEDRRRFALARRRGTISRRAGIGSLIEIHGDGGEGRDWTDGCVALTNEAMERLFAHVHVGVPVTIVGTYER